MPEKEVRELKELIRSLWKDLFGKKGITWLNAIIPQLEKVDGFILEEELAHFHHFSGTLDRIEGDLAQQAVEREDVHLLMSISISLCCSPFQRDWPGPPGPPIG